MLKSMGFYLYAAERQGNHDYARTSTDYRLQTDGRHEQVFAYMAGANRYVE